MSGYELYLQLPGLPKTTNGAHGHWRAAASQKKKWRTATKEAAILSGAPENPLSEARIELVRHSSSRPDYDNLVISFKPVIDGLRDAGVISDDKIANIGVPKYSWKKASPKNGHITISVSSL